MPIKNPAFVGEVRVAGHIAQRVYPIVTPSTTVAAKSATATLAVSDLDKILTNTGATGTIVLTLPKATNCRGYAVKIQVTVAQIVQVDPNGTEALFLGGSGAAGKYLNIAGVIGNYADLYCDGTNWLVTYYAGVLTKEA